MRPPSNHQQKTEPTKAARLAFFLAQLKKKKSSRPPRRGAQNDLLSTQADVPAILLTNSEVHIRAQSNARPLARPQTIGFTCQGGNPSLLKDGLISIDRFHQVQTSSDSPLRTPIARPGPASLVAVRRRWTVQIIQCHPIIRLVLPDSPPSLTPSVVSTLERGKKERPRWLTNLQERQQLFLSQN
jgi:hypothetical protein